MSDLHIISTYILYMVQFKLIFNDVWELTILKLEKICCLYQNKSNCSLRTNSLDHWALDFSY